MTQPLKRPVLVTRLPCGCISAIMDLNVAKSGDIGRFYRDAEWAKELVSHLRPGEEMPPWDCEQCKPLFLFTEEMLSETIRLACAACDRDDFDGITVSGLDDERLAGWEDIDEDITPEDPDDARWWTHLGTCPECVKGGAT